MNRSHSRTQSSVCNRIRLSVWDGSPPAAGKIMGWRGLQQVQGALSFAACQERSAAACWATIHRTCKTWQYLFKYGALHLRNTSLTYASGVCSHVCYMTCSRMCSRFSVYLHLPVACRWNLLPCCPTLVSDTSQLFIMCRSASTNLNVSHHGNRLVSPTEGVSFCVAKPDTYVLCAGCFWRDITK